MTSSFVLKVGGRFSPYLTDKELYAKLSNSGSTRVVRVENWGLIKGIFVVCTDEVDKCAIKSEDGGNTVSSIMLSDVLYDKIEFFETQPYEKKSDDKNELFDRIKQAENQLDELTNASEIDHVWLGVLNELIGVFGDKTKKQLTTTIGFETKSELSEIKQKIRKRYGYKLLLFEDNKNLIVHKNV